MVLEKTVPIFTRTDLEDYWPCAGGLSAVNARYAIVRPDKRGTDPIAVRGI